MKRILFLLAFAFFIVGCAPSNFNEMKSSADIKKTTFILNENYEDVYSRSLSKSKECLEMGGIIAIGQIYPKAKKGEIEVALISGMGKNLIHAATIKDIENGQTEVTLYTYWNEKYLDKMRLLFSGNQGKCD